MLWSYWSFDNAIGVTNTNCWRRRRRWWRRRIWPHCRSIRRRRTAHAQIRFGDWPGGDFSRCFDAAERKAKAPNRLSQNQLLGLIRRHFHRGRAANDWLIALLVGDLVDAEHHD